MSQVSGMHKVSDRRQVGDIGLIGDISPPGGMGLVGRISEAAGMRQVMDRTETAELVIQDPDARKMAAVLMRLTGQGLEVVVVTALRHAVEQAERRAQYHEQIMAITRDIAAGSSCV